MTVSTARHLGCLGAVSRRLPIVCRPQGSERGLDGINVNVVVMEVARIGGLIHIAFHAGGRGGYSHVMVA